MNEPEEIERYQKLWGTILVQGILDAISPAREGGARDEKRQRADCGRPPRSRDEQITDAWEWFASEDFATICCLVGISPEMMRHHLMPLIEAPHAVRAEFAERLDGRHWNCDTRRAA